MSTACLDCGDDVHTGLCVTFTCKQCGVECGPSCSQHPKAGVRELRTEPVRTYALMRELTDVLVPTGPRDCTRSTALVALHALVRDYLVARALYNAKGIGERNAEFAKLRAALRKLEKIAKIGQ